MMTVGVWKKTSKRYASMNKEMTKQSLLQNYFYTNELLTAISSNNIVHYVHKFGPYIPPSVVMVNKIHSYHSFKLEISENDLLFCDELEIEQIL